MLQYISDIFGNDVEIQVETIEEFEAMIADFAPDAVGNFDKIGNDYYFNGEKVLEEI